MVSSNNLSPTSTTTNNFISTQQIPEEATKQKKLPKSRIGYMEIDSFATADTKKSYFCYNCIYWLDTMGGKCMLVKEDGPDVFGKVSEVIAPHGWCNAYEPNQDKIK